MSEKHAKRERKDLAATKPVVEKKNTGAMLSNIVVILVVAAVAGLGIFATWDKIVTVFTPSETQTGQVQTIADVAESEGMTAEELLEKCGMTELGLTGESTADELYSSFTIESYAKYEDKTPEELKAENGIEDLPNDTNWVDASMKIPMSVMAEQSGMSFDEFAAQNGLPEEVTADMTYEDAMTVMQEHSAEHEAEEGSADAEVAE